MLPRTNLSLEKFPIIIIQARMQSTRLPGKVLQPLLQKPMLAFVVERARANRSHAHVLVATTTEPADDAIFDYCIANDISVFRGSEADVLARYVEAAVIYGKDPIIRITGDCPLIDPAIIDKAIELFRSGDYDYVGNAVMRTYPRGMDVEVFSLAALRKAALEAYLPQDREHVTPYFYRHPELFRLGHLTQNPNEAHYRLTVDTEEDMQLIRLILESLYPSNPLFTLEDILTLLKHHPQWININAHVQQRAL